MTYGELNIGDTFTFHVQGRGLSTFKKIADPNVNSKSAEWVHDPKGIAPKGHRCHFNGNVVVERVNNSTPIPVLFRDLEDGEEYKTRGSESVLIKHKFPNHNAYYKLLISNLTYHCVNESEDQEVIPLNRVTFFSQLKVGEQYTIGDNNLVYTKVDGLQTYNAFYDLDEYQDGQLYGVSHFPDQEVKKVNKTKK